MGEGPLFASVWLVCDASRYLLVHPLNLLGHVQIRTMDQALEYVRFFERGSFFFRVGLTEVKPADTGGCYEVPTAAFRKTLGEARVAVSKPTKGSIENGLCPSCAAFDIQRTAADEEGHVYELRERVLENGYYSVEGKRKLFDDPRKLRMHTVCQR